jgi:uncharacterized protein HemX
MGISPIAAVLAAGSLGVGAYSAIKGQEAQKKAQAQALSNAQMAQRQADEANNAAHQIKPDLSKIDAMNSVKQGNTLLTGAQGAQLSPSLLGKNTLLGQ